MSDPTVRPFQPFAEADVHPGGWLAAQMREDLRRGFVGWLDRIAPDLMVDDDIFVSHRLTAAVSAKELGAYFDRPDWIDAFIWWNAESQGNWREGWLRHCLWVGDPAHTEAARAWVERILDSQDEDGYLGIYAPDLRYRERGEHAELWAQAMLFRSLLAYHGHTGDARVLDAVRRGVERSMAGYPIGRSHPFSLDGEYGGVTHGLVFTDVLWELAGLTGDEGYLVYAEWLYRSYATSPIELGDVRAEALLDPARGFRAHGVHTYEHWRPLTVAKAAADAGLAGNAGPARGGPALPYAELDAAYRRKLEEALTPTGAPHGDEFCHPPGSAETTGYEYCSIQELFHAYGARIEATGEVALGDRMESLVFNIGMGAKDPVEGGVAYLKTDNSRSMTGPEGFKPAGDGPPQTRYMYSPLHREAAVCCVPNAGRLLPYYARYQWLRGEREGVPEVLALLFGESELSTSVAGVPVVIRQQTGYPAELEVRFVIEVPVAGEAGFTLAARRPAWARAVTVAGVDEVRVREDGPLLRIAGPWAGRTELHLRFDAGPEVRTAPTGESLVALGPLLYALPLPVRREIKRTFDVPGAPRPFRDVLVHPAGPGPALVVAPGAAVREAEPPDGIEAAGALHAWQRRALAVDAVDHRGRAREVVLVPMGATTLRLVAFPGS